MATNIGCAGTWFGQAEHHQDAGCLSGTIGAQQAKDFAGINMQVQLVYGGKFAIGFGQTRQLNDRILHRNYLFFVLLLSASVFADEIIH
ncbi:hypothetical protein [Sphingobacterium sp.]|uniref:hypothetical protein n=1 Tax=Sphingobacterium sp. TaxID=341027 RepID=UPI0031D82873